MEMKFFRPGRARKRAMRCGIAPGIEDTFVHGSRLSWFSKHRRKPKSATGIDEASRTVRLRRCSTVSQKSSRLGRGARRYTKPKPARYSIFIKLSSLGKHATAVRP